jgi:tetratricopeptide (TPR) repeat protein
MHRVRLVLLALGVGGAVFLLVGVGVGLLLPLAHQHAPRPHLPLQLQDDIQRADALFADGHYYAALQEYTRLSAQEPLLPPDAASILLRLGMVRTIRGEWDQAETALRQALHQHPIEPGAGAEQPSRGLARLYLSHVLREQGRMTEAAWVWAGANRDGAEDKETEDPRFTGPSHVLQAEWELRQTHYRTAEAHYRAATRYPLPSDWGKLVIYRLAFLDAATSASAALDELETGADWYAQWDGQNRGSPRGSLKLPHLPTRGPPLSLSIRPPDPFLTPLFPDIGSQAGTLLGILRAEPVKRAQLLGQFYLGQSHYALARDQFARVPPVHPLALAAAVSLAYSRWQEGDIRGSIRDLETLAAAHPDQPRLRVMLALAYLTRSDPDAARLHIHTLTQNHPDQPEIYLSWSHWYLFHRDYVNASRGYQKAMAQAVVPFAQRGRYALLTARYHLATTYAVCEEGLPAAETAVRALPNQARAWTTLAASRYYCRDLSGARAAAYQALNRGAGAEAAFYLGATLLDMGDIPAARTALVQAADEAPDTIWRERAEARLSSLGNP